MEFPEDEAGLYTGVAGFGGVLKLAIGLETKLFGGGSVGISLFLLAIYISG